MGKASGAACRQQQDDYVCTADYQFPAPVETVQVECTLASVTVPNTHISAGSSGRQKRSSGFRSSLHPSRNPLPPSHGVCDRARGTFGINARSPRTAPLLFLVSLALAARSRRELAALTASFIAAEVLACAIAPRMSLSLSPRFIQAAAALTIAYLAFEIILLPHSAWAGWWWRCWVCFTGRTLRPSSPRAVITWRLFYRRRHLRTAPDRVVRLPSGSAGAPGVLAPRSTRSRFAATRHRRGLVFPALAGLRLFRGLRSWRHAQL